MFAIAAEFDVQKLSDDEIIQRCANSAHEQRRAERAGPIGKNRQELA
jgi:hypothetical protein